MTDLPKQLLGLPGQSWAKTLKIQEGQAPSFEGSDPGLMLLKVRQYRQSDLFFKSSRTEVSKYEEGVRELLLVCPLPLTFLPVAKS